MAWFNRRALGLSLLALCAAAVLQAGPALAGVCSATLPITQLSELPFAGTVPNNTTAGFAFDQERYSVDGNLPSLSMYSKTESSLAIQTLNTATGAFTGLIGGPWSAATPSAAAPNGLAVTGTILPTSPGYFSISFSYTVYGLLTNSYSYAFAGAIQSLVKAHTTGYGTVCDQELYIAGMYTLTHVGPVLHGGTATTVTGPAPFSGIGYYYYHVT